LGRLGAVFGRRGRTSIGCEKGPEQAQDTPKMAAKKSRAARLGKALTDARRAAGLTRCGAAEAAGVSLSAAKAAEQGRGLVETFQRMARASGHELTARQTGGGLGGLPSMRARAMSQRQAAQAAGLSRGAVAAVESGSRAARVETLAEYAAALGAGLALVPAGQAVGFFGGLGRSSGWHGWETPADLFDLIERGAGAFDLDPCAPDKPGTVRSTRRYTATEDGLSREWRGRVFMNPPYGRALPRWLAKAAAEAEAGAEVVGLVPLRSETEWWHTHVVGRAAVFVLRGRLFFGDGEWGAPFGSALVVWGGSPETLAGLQAAIPRAWFIPRQQV
jgi:phage N-6-adenine-methyltransferase